MRKKGLLNGMKVVMVALLLVFAVGIGSAQAATQGDVALNLANLLGLSFSPATQEAAISALNALGISPAGGWNAGAAADSGFISSLYTSVNAAYASGKVASSAGLGSASASLAAACTMSGISGNTAVGAITGAGGNAGQANQGASYGSSYAGGTGGAGGGGGAGGAGFGPGGPGGAGGSGGGGGGGGGTVSPSR